MVKLINFYEFAPLNRLREQMKADLIEKFSFDSGISLLEEDFITRLENDGIEIESLDEIEFRDDHTIGYNGQRVLIYIRDVSHYRDELKLPKFHFATCETLVKMWKNKRSQRYVLHRRESGVFQINLMKQGATEIRHEKLAVCRNCLTNLNWNNYVENKSLRGSIVSDFSITNFFLKYPKTLVTLLPSYDSDTAPLNDYTEDWSRVSNETKKKAGNRCENPKCMILLQDHLTKYLHVHHIDGQKNNNNINNLKALCVKCHANEYNHDHLKSSPDYKKFLVEYDELKSKGY